MRMHVCDYDARASAFVTALRLLRSAVPSTVCRWEFLFFFGLHLLACLLFMWGKVPGFQHNSKASKVAWNQVQVITTVTVFVEVFYTQACFKRYLMLYSLCRQLLLQVSSACFNLRLHLMLARPKHVRLSARYLFAGVLMFFQDTNAERQVDTMHDLLEKAGYSLTRVEERNFLAQLDGPERCIVVIAWATEVWRLGAQQAGVPANIQMSLATEFSEILETMHLLKTSLKLMVPFPYFHILNLMVSVNLVLWAYCMAASMSYTSIFTYLLAEIVFMGMLVLASEMADPFGEDKVDFPLADWLRETVEFSIKLLEYKREIKLRNPRALGMSTSLSHAKGRLENLSHLAETGDCKGRTDDLAVHRFFREAFTPDELLAEARETEQETEDDADDDDD